MQELKNKDAAVVVFSGGQDSTTCLFWALKRYKKVIALSFDYHQKHVKELECAKKICRDHEVEHHIMDMSLLNQLALTPSHGRYQSRRKRTRRGNTKQLR